MDQKAEQTSQLNEQTVRYFMKQALKQAQKAFDDDQVPVGCVFIAMRDNSYKIIERSHNLTNKTKNASRHCQINCLKKMQQNMTPQQIAQTILLVTVEPCIMCAHALNTMGVKKAYFGQFNDRFGGCGSVLQCNQFQYVGGIMEQESLHIIKKFYQRGNQRLPLQQRNRKNKMVKKE